VTAEPQDSSFGAFVAVFAALLLDNVVHFEETVARVTDLVMSSGKPSRELIVALQSFDRLKQEFEALGDALTRYAESHATPITGEERARLEQSVIDAITVADLRERLLDRLQEDLPQDQAPLAPDVEAQINVDVVF
jgi:flagellar motor switch protein FliG